MLHCVTKHLLSASLLCLNAVYVYSSNDTLFTLTPCSPVAQQKRAAVSVASFTGDTLFTMYLDYVNARNPEDVLVRTWDMKTGGVIADVTVSVYQPADLSRSLNQIVCIKGQWVLFTTRDPSTICCYSLPSGSLISTCTFPKKQYFDDLLIREIDAESGFFVYRFKVGDYGHAFDILNNLELNTLTYIRISTMVKDAKPAAFTKRGSLFAFTPWTTSDSCRLYEYDCSTKALLDSVETFYPLSYDREEDVFFQKKLEGSKYTVREYDPRTRRSSTSVCHFTDSLSYAFFVPKRRAVIGVSGNGSCVCRDLRSDTVMFALKDTAIMEVALSPDFSALVLRSTHGLQALRVSDFSLIMKLNCTWAGSASLKFISPYCILCDRAETTSGIDIFDLSSGTVFPWHVEPVMLSVSGNGKNVVVYDDSSRAYRRFEISTAKPNGNVLGAGITMYILGAVNLRDASELLMYGPEEASGLSFRRYNPRTGVTILRRNILTGGNITTFERGFDAAIYLDPKNSPNTITALRNESLEQIGSLTGDVRFLHYSLDAKRVLVLKNSRELKVLDASTLVPVASRTFDTSIVSGVIAHSDSAVLFNTYDYRVGKWWLVRDTVIWLRNKFSSTELMQTLSPAGRFVITSRALMDVTTGDESSIPERDFQSMSDYVGLYNNDSLYMRQSIDGIMRASTKTSQYEEVEIDFNKVSAFFHPTLPLEVITGVHGTTTELYDVRDSMRLLSSAPIPFTPHQSQGKQFAWSADGSTLSFVSTTGTLYVWRPTMKGLSSVDRPDTSSEGLQVIPSPATAYIAIIHPPGTRGRLDVEDYAGRILFSQEVQNDEPIVVSTLRMQNGVYVARFQTMNSTFVVAR